MQSKTQFLFAVYLGGRAAGCNTELHDVVFVVGPSLEATYPQLFTKWFGLDKGLHIDAWTRLDQIDGYRIELKSQPSEDDKKLFFVNLGAYMPGKFTELHDNVFIVATSAKEAKKHAKAKLLQGMFQVHTDDLYDVDDCIELDRVSGFHIHLQPADVTTKPEVHCKYLVLPSDQARA